ncbi:alpha/beta fold hydrolase [Ureibacillus sp. MALMAid1270]|uniref:alpha/beta fold hydrolase n=1 Tax=Ureibacillus sp. MALMAid1270 TaxID=3411629 RepID=UPI003BA4D9FB
MWIQRFVETKRGKFELFEKGDGEPLVITHLYSEFDIRGNAFASSFTELYHVYLINLRGAGNSVGAQNESEYSMDETVLDLEAIREALGIDKWAFGGHSTGGMLALKYAVLKESSLTKIIVSGAAASIRYNTDPNSIYNNQNPNFNRIREIMNAFNDPDLPVEERKKLSREWTLMSFYKEENLAKAYEKPSSAKTVGERLDYFRKVDCQSYDVTEQIKQVTIPAFVCSGLHDAQCPYRFGVEIADLIPNATLTTFEQSNHYPFWEEEQAFNEFVKLTTETKQYSKKVSN